MSIFAIRDQSDDVIVEAFSSLMQPWNALHFTTVLMVSLQHGWIHFIWMML